MAGLGGLGGFLAELLARVGVGRLLLADGDHFTPANLNRQLLATEETLGLNKAVVTARRLRKINPAILAEPIVQFLTPDNLGGYLSQVQVVVDGLDTIAARQELAAGARDAGLPLVHGAVSGKFGQVSTLMPAGATGGSAARHPALARTRPPLRKCWPRPWPWWPASRSRRPSGSSWGRRPPIRTTWPTSTVTPAGWRFCRWRNRGMRGGRKKPGDGRRMAVF